MAFIDLEASEEGGSSDVGESSEEEHCSSIEDFIDDDPLSYEPPQFLERHETMITYHYIGKGKEEVSEEEPYVIAEATPETQADPMQVEEPPPEDGDRDMGPLPNVDPLPDAPLTENNSTVPSFRLAAKSIFITYPQCPFPVDRVVSTYVDYFKDTNPVKELIVGQEKHTDGNYHLHLYVSFSRKINIKSSFFFDILPAPNGEYYHPNFSSVKSKKAVIIYVTKGGEFRSYGINPEAWINAKRSKKSYSFEEAALQIASGTSVHQLAREHPGFVMQHLSKIQAFSTFLRTVPPVTDQMTRLKDYYHNRNPTIPADLAVTLGENRLSILKWVLKNCFCGVPFQRKAPQLMIVSPTNYGKTSLVMELSRMCETYILPMDENFYDGYDDGIDLVLIEEFRATKTIQWMNQFLEGTPMQLRIKGGQYPRRVPKPAIILSNLTLAQVYHNKSQQMPPCPTFIALQTRIHEIILGKDSDGNPETLFSIIDFIKKLLDHEV